MTIGYEIRGPLVSSAGLLALVAAGATIFVGCSSSTTGSGQLSTGGAAASGGTTIVTAETGGRVSTGGTTGTGGSPGTGGAPIVGASGGVAISGGIISSGGAAVLGGVTGVGGAPRTGGTVASGGTAAGTGGTTIGAGGTNNAGGYVFACFDDAAAVSSMQIYTSTDALNFTKLLDTGFGGPTGNLRDPSIMKHTDGNYYVVHTTPPAGTGCCGAEASFNVAKSSDLKKWTNITQVPCGVAGVKNVWAPEWFKDSDGSLHVLVSVDQKTYRYEPTDATFTKWGAGTWIGIGPDYIDTFIVKLGATYHAFTKLESATIIRHATSTTIDGPWTFLPDPTIWGVHKEAPAVIQLGNGTWRIFMDAGSAGHEVYSDSTDTFQTWTAPKALPAVGAAISHGTVIHDN
jgi:hypothetical protein